MDPDGCNAVGIELWGEEQLLPSRDEALLSGCGLFLISR